MCIHAYICITLKTVEDPKSRCVRTFLRKIPHGTSCSLTLVSDHQLFAFWVIAYGRFDCTSLIFTTCSLDTEEKSLRHVDMVAKFLDEKKPKTSLKK